MSEFTSYYLYQKFEQRGEQEAIPVYPNVYSIDADGTRERVIKLENDPQCGYEPQEIYRWVNIPIEEDSICEDCEVEPIYRWTNIDPTEHFECEGNTKYYYQYREISFDNGETWKNWFDLFECYSNRRGEIIEECSEDCGCEEFNGKWLAIYEDGHKESRLCSTESSNVQAGEITLSYLTFVNFGLCTSAIMEYALRYCKTLTTIKVTGHNLKLIGTEAFNGCTNLTNISSLDDVTEIRSLAFKDCTSLTSVTIGSNITKIGDGAFKNCSGLTSITIHAVTPPSIGHGEGSFDGSSCPIYVPAESVESYKSDRYWRYYSSRIQPIS